MHQLYYWPTPNGHKVTIFLEEAGLDYRLRPVNIGAGEQFDPEFLKVSPNNKMPALVDTDADDLAVFESGAILVYLAEKTGKFLPGSGPERYDVLQWLFWQMGGLGPMLGQNHHFNRYAPEPIPYAIERYTNETTRLYNVLNRRLEGRDYICGEYSIADMASYPWIVPWETQKQNLDDFPALKDWFERMRERPAVKKAYALADDFERPEEITDEIRKNLFGHTDTKPAD